MSEREKLLAVKAAADMVVVIIGAQGEINSRHPAVLKLLTAIEDLESGEPVKYGCTHPRYGSTPECVLDDSSCATNAAGKIACFADSNEKCRTITDKAKCAHWRPIK